MSRYRPTCGRPRSTFRSWGAKPQQKLCLHGLRSSAGYLQSKISDRIDTRYTPKLRFEVDEGVKKSLAIHQMLHELLPDTNPLPESAGDDSAAAEPVPKRRSNRKNHLKSEVSAALPPTLPRIHQESMATPNRSALIATSESDQEALQTRGSAE